MYKVCFEKAQFCNKIIFFEFLIFYNKKKYFFADIFFHFAFLKAATNATNHATDAKV